MNRISGKFYRPVSLLAMVAGILLLSVGCFQKSSDNQRGGQSRYADKIRALDGEVQIHLDFTGSNITDDDLASLPFHDTVRSLSLRDTSITDRGLKEVQRARNLERLDLRNTQVTDNALDILEKLPRLWEARISSPHFSERAQRQLGPILSHRRKQIAYDESRQLSRQPAAPPSRRQ